MSQVVGTKKFHSLEVVDSAKFDNEIVFEDLTMDGEDLTIALAGVFSLTSLATDTTSPVVDFVGISMTAVEEVQIQSTSSQASILGGDEVTGANAAVTEGSVVLGHTLDSAVIPVVEVVLPATGSANAAIGFFNTTPVVQQDNTVTAATPFAANTSGISDDTATFGGYRIGQIVGALQAYGILA